MTVVQFEDLHTDPDPNHIHNYIVSNEERDKWDKLLDGITVKRAVGIASSGEVGFFTLLPHVEDELVLLDHSRPSLAVAMSKFLLLRAKGAEETRRLFTSVEWKELKAALDKEVRPYLPDSVKVAFDNLGGRRPSGYGHTLSFQDSNYADIFDRDGPKPIDSVNRDLKRAWLELPEDLVKAGCERLDKVSFLHGDLSDVVKQGPFGLYYTSNALDHESRHSYSTNGAKINDAIAPGGYVLRCHNGYGSEYKDKVPVDWTVVKDCSRKKPTYPPAKTAPLSAHLLRWSYILYQTSTKKAVKA